MADIKSAVKEIEDLFGTTSKDNVIYFNEINYTPIPLPVVNAVKLIMSEYPNLGCHIGLYSVKVFEQNVHPINVSHPIQNSVNKEIDSSKVGTIHDEYVIGKISKEEAIKNLTDNGYENAEDILKKWKEPIQSARKSFIKSSLSEFFPVSEEEGEELDELAKTFTDKSELRSVLEDYFHIYDDYAVMSVQDFDRYLADYFDSNNQ